MNEIKKEIESAICECDLDSVIEDEMLDAMVDKLSDLFESLITDALNNKTIDFYSGVLDALSAINDKLETTNEKYLAETSMSLYEFVHGRGAV